MPIVLLICSLRCASRRCAAAAAYIQAGLQDAALQTSWPYNNMIASTYGAGKENSLLIVDWVKRIRVGISVAELCYRDGDGSGDDDREGEPMHTTCINSVVFSPDGSKLVTGAGSIRIWATRGPTLRLMAAFTVTCAVAFSSDGLLLASCDYRQRVYVWNMSAVDERLRDIINESDIDALPTPSDGTTGHLASRTVPKLWPQALFIPSRQSFSAFSDATGVAVTFSRDGNRIFMADSHSSVYAWDMQQQNAIDLLQADGSLKKESDLIHHDHGDPVGVANTNIGIDIIKPLMARDFRTTVGLPQSLSREYWWGVPTALGAFASGDMLAVSAYNIVDHHGSVLVRSIAASAGLVRVGAGDGDDGDDGVTEK